MHLYLAGTSVSTPSEEKTLQKLFKRGFKLHSYWHIHGFEKNWFNMNKKNKVKLFLDSGAFSAFTQGVTIDIQEYIQFIKDNQDSIEVYANLDVIGDPEGTYKNQLIMEKVGLSPLPVFHFGEDPEKYLKPLVEKYDYICIGGMVKSGALTDFIDRCFSKYICDKNGIPKVKVHGFGLTSVPLMMRYPWYSVDSTSWVVTGRMGGIFVPYFKDGKWVYDQRSFKVSVSAQSPNLKEAGQHLQNMSPTKQKIIHKYIEEKGYSLGVSHFRFEQQDYELKEGEKWASKKPKDPREKRKVELIVEKGISNTYQLRDEMNIIYFLDLEKSMPSWPWPFKTEVMTPLF